MNYAKEKIHPDKSRGQNFLVDERVLAKIVEAAELKKSDRVIEIGAGTGVLTKELAARVKKVIAFEIDKKLIPILQENLKNFKNVDIYDEDILKCHSRENGNLEKARDWIPACAGMTMGYKLIANIPYNITSAILEKFLAAPNKPSLMVLLVQKEVAERVCALPGKMSLLSVMAQYFGHPKIVKIVPSSAFYPQPKVESAILKIIVGERFIAPEFENRFFQVVKVGFKQKRKMLKNNLRALDTAETIKNVFNHLKLSENIRAEDMAVNQWVRLTQNLRQKY